MGRLSPAGFHTVCGFRRPDVNLFEISRQVCGLDYPFLTLKDLAREYLQVDKSTGRLRIL
jgi:hypothetical protein